MMRRNNKFTLLILANILSSVGSGITAFVIPFLIISLPHGERIYGYLYLGVGILTLLITPFIGVLIDRFSRKKILLICELSCAIIFTIVIVLYLFQFVTNIMICLFILTLATVVYSAIQIPTLIAFVQESFTQEEYSKVNSALEVQGQVGTFISAGVTAIFSTYISTSFIFAFNILTYLLAFTLLAFIPYQHTRREQAPDAIAIKFSFLEDITVGWQFIKMNKSLMIFLLCCLTPSIMVLIGNYINPVFIFKDLGAGTNIQGYSSLIYAFSAMLGGILATLLAKRYGNFISSFFTFVAYLAGIVLIVLQPFVGVFLAARVLAGIGNSASRVLRKNIIMSSIPSSLSGRINSFMNSYSLIVQFLIVGSISSIIEWIGGRGSFFIISLLMSASLLIMIISYRVMQRHPISSNSNVSADNIT